MKEHKTQLIIAVTVFILIILIVINYVLSNKKLSVAPVTPETISSKSFTPIETAPTLPPSRGAGIDIQSTSVQQSKQEIEKIKGALPFSKTITVGGTEVTIKIPEAALQDYSWSLIVYLPDLDFQVPTEAPHYSKTKDIFRAASVEVYEWIRQQGADPQKIIIVWGDTDYSQARAKEWLQ